MSVGLQTGRPTDRPATNILDVCEMGTKRDEEREREKNGKNNVGQRPIQLEEWTTRLFWGPRKKEIRPSRAAKHNN